MSPGLTKCSLEARSPPLGTTDLENSVMWEKGLRSVWKHRWVRPYLLKMFAVVTLPIPCSLPEPCRFFLKWWKLPGEAFRPFSWGHSSHAPWHLCHALEATKGGMASAWLYLGYLFMKPAPHSGGGAPRPHGEACTERHKGCCPDPQLSFHQRPHQLASHVREPSWVQNLWAAVDQPSQWCVGQGWSFSAKSALTVDSLARAVIIAVSSRYVLVWFVTQQWMNRAEGLV